VLGKLERKNLIQRIVDRDVLCILNAEGLEALMV
jgi:hypothetical protein